MYTKVDLLEKLGLADDADWAMVEATYRSRSDILQNQVATYNAEELNTALNVSTLADLGYLESIKDQSRLVSQQLTELSDIYSELQTYYFPSHIIPNIPKRSSRYGYAVMMAILGIIFICVVAVAFGYAVLGGIVMKGNEPAATATPLDYSLCPDTLPSFLIKNRYLVVKSSLAQEYLPIYDDDLTTVIARLPADVIVSAQNGPICQGKLYWEILDDQTGMRGWAAESSRADNAYYLELTDLLPENDCASQTSFPGPLPPTSLKVGMQVIVKVVRYIDGFERVSEYVNSAIGLYSRPDPTVSSFDSIETDTQLTLLAGPVCNSDIYWFVRTEDGREGWVEEGDHPSAPVRSFLIPINN